MADRWGVDELTVGKVVWCELDEAGVQDIHAVMRHWMLEAVPDPEAEALLRRLAADEAERRGVA
ncbi:hypothetical protein [Streptomyces sp. NPDC058457]|uniref:hypothetical protein n=1 Tax=Streptomyces sp. NPDC058457 TaxID=3346507 RepID=UPI003668938A